MSRIFTGKSITTPFPVISRFRSQVGDLFDMGSYKVKVRGRISQMVLHVGTEGGGYWVECQNVPGCRLQGGDTVDKALEMVTDAIEGGIDVLSKQRKEKKA